MIDLSKLSDQELLNLKNKLTFELTRRGITIKPNNGQSFLKDIILQELRKVVPTPSNFVIQRDSSGVDTKLTVIAKEITILAVKHKFNREETIKLCQVLVKATVNHIHELGNEINFNYMISCMMNPVNILDNQFPGYLSSNLFKMFLGE